MLRASVYILPSLLACTVQVDDPDDTDTVDTDLDATGWLAHLDAPGTYSVGFQKIDVSYDDPAGDGTRTLSTSVWYPTNATGGAVTTFTGPQGAQGVQLDVDPAAGPFPLAIFSHGHQGDADNVSHLMAHLASHGWVAAAPEHTGNTLADGDNRTTAIYLQRPLDVSAALDHLLDADPTFASRLDGRVLGLGHSFGGYTTFLLAGATFAVDHWAPLCEGDDDDTVCNGWSADVASGLDADLSEPRISAFVTMSGGNWGQIREAGFASVDRPLLQMSGALDSSVSNEGSSDPIWRDLPTGDRIRADLAHGDHQTYTDFAGVGGGIIPGSSADGLPTDRAQRLVRIWVGAFGARHTLGATGLDPLLDGTVVIDDDVRISAK